MTGNLLQIEDLHVEVEGREILKGLNLSVDKGEIHALMGPNGSGKSTLAYLLTRGKGPLQGRGHHRSQPRRAR